MPDRFLENRLARWAIKIPNLGSSSFRCKSPISLEFRLQAVLFVCRLKPELQRAAPLFFAPKTGRTGIRKLLTNRATFAQPAVCVIIEVANFSPSPRE